MLPLREIALNSFSVYGGKNFPHMAFVYASDCKVVFKQTQCQMSQHRDLKETG